jgi:hypothetical protein
MEEYPMLTQIAYVPLHAEGDLSHENVEFGFIVSGKLNGNSYRCRYWSQTNPNELRTKANSEITYEWSIVLHQSHPQEDVIRVWDEIQKGV